MIGMLRGLMSKDFLEVGELDNTLYTLNICSVGWKRYIFVKLLDL